jgi:hypothetical protein
MGTRHLIAVQKNNSYKVAQYGQWDGYLSGQGDSILKFFHENDLEVFRTKIDNCFFGTEEQINEAFAAYSTDGWMTFEQSKAFKESQFGHLSRDTGSDILDIIMKSDGPLMMTDNIDFAKDSLFCEYAYVIDLNRNVLEVYEGFNEEPIEPGQRFYSEENKDGYYPVKLVKEYSLFDLPENFDELEKELNPEEGEEEE